MMSPLSLMLVLAAHAALAAAAPCPPQADTAGSTAASEAELIARAAQQLRGDATVAEALRIIRVVGINREPASAAEHALAALGFDTALDLRLLAGGPEAAELMSELRTGGLS